MIKPHNPAPSNEGLDPHTKKSIEQMIHWTQLHITVQQHDYKLLTAVNMEILAVPLKCLMTLCSRILSV